jgi:hypothetical protein
MVGGLPALMRRAVTDKESLVMKWIRLACVGGCLAWFTAAASAQNAELGRPLALGGPPCPPLIGGPTWNPPAPGCPAPSGAMPPGSTATPTTPSTTPPSTTPSPESPALPGEAFAQAPEAGTQAAGSLAPALFGDLIGIRGGRVVLIPQGARNIRGVTPLTGNIIAVIAPMPLHASYKITEGESPRPENRAYISYNYYDNVDRLFPESAVGRSNLNRETLGFEQTFGGGDSSLGLRLPFLQLVGDKQVEDNAVGDLSIIYKHAIIDDRQTGNLLSAGMVVTLPTGQGLHIGGESTLNSTVFQPFVGYIWNIDDFYIDGFSSLAVPTDFRDVTLLFNSVAVGYCLYRDCSGNGLVRAVSPQVEMHVNTPLSHRGLTSTPVNFSDSVNLTGGCHVLFRRSELGFAVGTPVTGPKPYDLEANATLTFRW